jgi:hypothetical protein
LLTKPIQSTFEATLSRYFEFFWDLRSKLGVDAVDSLLAMAWSSYMPTGADSTIRPAFVAALLSAAKKQGPEMAKAVQSAAAARKIPTP